MAHERILIVEDNELNAKLLRDVLQVEGYATTEAGTAEQGLAAVRSEAPALVLMDIHLPRMDGVELLKRGLDAPAMGRALGISRSAAYRMQQEAKRRGLLPDKGKESGK